MPQITHIFWSDDPDENVIEHLAEHGVTVEEAEAVLRDCFDQREVSAADTGRFVVKGFTPAGRFLVVVFDYYEDHDLVVPVTAYEPELEQ